jgi:hypothetical protein
MREGMRHGPPGTDPQRSLVLASASSAEAEPTLSESDGAGKCSGALWRLLCFRHPEPVLQQMSKFAELASKMS